MAQKKRARSKPEAGPALSRLQGDFTQLRREAKAFIARMRKQATQLISRDQRRTLERLRSDVEKRLQRAASEAESRIEHVVSAAEKRLEPVVEGFVRRLDVASRKEVHGLARRLAQLERRVQSRPARHRKAAVPKQPPPHPPEVVVPSDDY